MGIRAKESVKRKKRSQIDYLKKFRIWHYKPIFTWEKWEIWEYIRRNNLPYCSLYDEGFDRIGCMICPMMTWKKHQFHRKKWPGVYKAFEHAMKKKWNNIPAEKRIDNTFEQFLTYWYGKK